jgi:NAD(P)H-dependent flavin oxidoreductase YrpB (nitropropane dioxygenase family)
MLCRDAMASIAESTVSIGISIGITSTTRDEAEFIRHLSRNKKRIGHVVACDEQQQKMASIPEDIYITK